ncbi:MAG: ATP-binding protein, partial [Tangfeifania sp.]
MKYLNRLTEILIKNNLKPNKVVVLLGARRTGKSILIQKIISETNEKKVFLNGEDFTTLSILQPRSIENYRSLLGGADFLIIDEAQQIPEIGKILKLMVDNIPEIKILVSGSSAFDISNKTGEPLTGRKSTVYLFPFSQQEYSSNENIIDTKAKLNERLILGNYPELWHFTGKKEKLLYLKELVSSYLLKDILTYDGIRNSDKILRLLKLIA